MIFKKKYSGLIILCLLIILLFFIFSSKASKFETDIFIPFDIKNIPTGLIITNPHPKGIDIRIRGPKKKIAAIKKNKPYLMDLSSIKIGINSIPIDPSRINLPKKIKLIKTNPTFITIITEKKLTKRLPVMVSLSGTPGKGFYIADFKVKPRFLKVEGPESILGPIEKLMTKPVQVDGLGKSLKKEIAVQLAENLTLVSSNGIIKARIIIEEKVVNKNLNNLTVIGKGSAYDFIISPPVIDIEIKGPANALNKLKKEGDIIIYIDLKSLTPGVYVRRASINLPVKTTLVNVKPEIFTVTIKKK